MSSLYDTDVLEWSEHQARLLRHQAEGRPANETPDWTNIIEEIESVGRSQLNAVQSLLIRALLHDLKCKAWPLSRDVDHWRAEARGFRRDAARIFAPSMRQRIDVAELYADALVRLPETMDGHPALPIDPQCRFTLDELLAPVPHQT